MIDVCICTHSADKDIFNKVLDAISHQTLTPRNFCLIIIDNLSSPPVDIKNKKLKAIEAKGIKVKVIQEPNLGIAHARIRALKESKAEAIIFVDDDNVLDPDFLKISQNILEKYPEVGCFSGKIELHQNVILPDWIKPLLGSLAIRDAGEKIIVDWFRGTWAPWMPACTASMVLRKQVIKHCLETHGLRDDFYQFGRKGRKNLMSGEDFLIALSAGQAGYKCGYFPNLKMSHYIRTDRLTFKHMSRLMYSMARTDLKREKYLGLMPIPFSQDELKYRLLALNIKSKNPSARLCHWLYEVTYVAGKAYQLIKTNQPFYSGKPFGS